MMVEIYFINFAMGIASQFCWGGGGRASALGGGKRKLQRGKRKLQRNAGRTV